MAISSPEMMLVPRYKLVSSGKGRNSEQTAYRDRCLQNYHYQSCGRYDTCCPHGGPRNGTKVLAWKSEDHSIRNQEGSATTSWTASRNQREQGVFLFYAKFRRGRLNEGTSVLQDVPLWSCFWVMVQRSAVPKVPLKVGERRCARQQRQPSGFEIEIRTSEVVKRA